MSEGAEKKLCYLVASLDQLAQNFNINLYTHMKNKLDLNGEVVFENHPQNLQLSDGGKNKNYTTKCLIKVLMADITQVVVTTADTVHRMVKNVCMMED